MQASSNFKVFSKETTLPHKLAVLSAKILDINFWLSFFIPVEAGLPFMQSHMDNKLANTAGVPTIYILHNLVTFFSSIITINYESYTHWMLAVD